jgi:signal transduction histidine kinase
MIIVLLAECLCALAFSAAALLHERRARVHAFDVMLQGRSDSLLGAVQDAEDADSNVMVDPAELHIPASDVYAVYNQGGRIIGQSDGAPAALTRRSTDGIGVRHVNGREYRVLQRDALRVIDRAEFGGVGLRRPVTIVYASPSDHIGNEIMEAAQFYVVVGIVLIGATAAALIVLLRRVLRPISELADEAASVAPPALRFRPPESALQVAELRPLAEALSTTVESLRLAFENEHRFVGDAAHELKTSVAIVRSAIEVLMMKPRSEEEYRRGLRRALEDTERVNELVSRMLMLARTEERTPSLRTSADIAEGVERGLEKLRSFAEAHGIELVRRIETPVSVHLAADDAEILVTNLVVNAIQHSPSGSVVEVTLARRGESAVLNVVDRGSGISESALPHIFERFFREDVSRSRETGGVGLGLAISKSIVDAAGGVIHVSSAPGAGTTVNIAFSLA